jgi:hypothetical protein
MQPGDIVQFGGKSWKINVIDEQRDVVELISVDDDPLRETLRFASGSPFSGSYERVEVTAEQLMREQVEREAFDIMGRFTGVQSWGRQADPRGMEQTRVEAEMRASLAKMGIAVDGDSALATMLNAVASQIAAVSAQAAPARGQFKSIADLMSNLIPQDDVADEAVLASRKAELDAKFSEPEGEGFFVFWRGKAEPASSRFVFRVDDINFPPPVFTESVHRCDSIDDAWAFVDYLKDDEAGEAICIREDSCVLFYRGDAGWEALTRDPVPDEYREEE